MAAPDPYAGTSEEFNPALHWGNYPAPAERSYTGESVAGHDPSGEGFYSQSSGEESLVGVIDSARLRGFMRYCLGYNNVNTVSDYQLQRTNPICHPRMTNMVCTGVAHRGFKPIRPNPPPGSINSGLQLKNNDSTTGVVAVLEDGITVRTLKYYAGYEMELVTLRFSPAPYKFFADGIVSTEYRRNTIIDTEPRTEVLTLSGFQIIYAEGDGNTAPNTNAKSKASPGDKFQVLIKPDLKVTWYNVPEKFISQNSISLPGQVYPAKIVKALGTLNRYKWIEWEKGTLLCVGAHLTRKPWSLAAGGNNDIDPFPGNARESTFNYDIEFLLSYFNPPKGLTSNSLIVNPDTYGHNCLPYRGVIITGVSDDDPHIHASDDGNAGKWFYGTYSGKLVNIGADNASLGIYRYSNFDNMFSSVWMPDLT